MTFETTSAFAQTWGLVYLVVLFVAVLVYALRPANRETFDAAARRPLEDD